MLEGIQKEDHGMVCVPMYYGTGEPGTREDRPTWSVTRGWSDEGGEWGQYMMRVDEAIADALDAMNARPDEPAAALRLMQDGLMRLARKISEEKQVEKNEAREKTKRAESNAEEERSREGPERLAPKDKRERLRWGVAKWRRLREAAERWSGRRGNKRWHNGGLWKQPVVRDDAELDRIPSTNERKYMRARRNRMIEICDEQIQMHREKLRGMGLPKGDQILERMEEAAQSHMGMCMIETFNIVREACGKRGGGGKLTAMYRGDDKNAASGRKWRKVRGDL